MMIMVMIVMMMMMMVMIIMIVMMMTMMIVMMIMMMNSADDDSDGDDDSDDDSDGDDDDDSDDDDDYDDDGDVDNVISIEKTSVLYACKLTSPLLISIYRELESALEKERDSCSSAKGKVISLEENLELERRTFAEDLDEKQKMIAKLSKQLEIHEKNFEALKSELTQVHCIKSDVFPLVNSRNIYA